MHKNELWYINQKMYLSSNINDLQKRIIDYV